MSSAWAAPYEVEPDVDGELELFGLMEEGTLSAESWAALVALRRAGVEPERATRDTLHALPGLTYAEVDAWLRARDSGDASTFLTAAEARRLAPFLVEEDSGRVTGDARLLTAFALSDSRGPPVALQVRAGGVGGLRVGVLAVWARRRVGTPRREARSRALVVEAPGSAVLLPKFHARWTGTRASVLVGTYRLGFGQRLTLDTTALPSPEGFLPEDGVSPPGAPERECLLTSSACDEDARDADITPDFRWDEPFRGVAGSVRGGVGDGLALTLTGFGSYQGRSLRRSEVLDRGRCSSSGACSAPEVLVPVAGARRAQLRASVLPGMFREWAGGGNATLAVSPRARIGLTGWGARPGFAVEGAVLDFQPGARYPAGGGFGAVGVDAAWGTGPVDVFLELSRSFDSVPGEGGGWAALQRTVVSGVGRELEVSLRYYGRGFVNPYSGATSGPDVLEGQRVRNELGVRLRYLHRDAGAWRFRGQVDGWTWPSDGVVEGTAGLTRLRASARMDVLAWTGLQPSLRLDARLSGAGRSTLCARVERDEDAEPDEVAACSSGGRQGATARVRSVLSERVEVAAEYGQARVVETGTSAARWDGRALVEVKLRPAESWRVGGRVQWRDEDMAERTRLRQEVRTTVDLRWSVLEGTTMRGRYAWVVDLKDARTARMPPDEPRHLFQLDVETRF
ncbi:hypothetical protein LXT21_42910 [Myxococcus sp. K38C18041901]|uniref:hypothetical protein n=1 Tax=Myxococcus guangdongensis TaxID=2906760 RepID=UPI0020A79AE7|nr:hypothetical protein [Myxococcus guangdongensis]MCP3065537.1 hypothetical protein [Myxococcus guangdongensis]